MRRTTTLLMILGGIVLMVVSFFLLAAPWGATTVENSNPRMQFAPALFVLGVLLVFLSAVVYELLPDRRKR
jgi:ABC-type antimicrobial peptide transport system permease subunit